MVAWRSAAQDPEAVPGTGEVPLEIFIVDAFADRPFAGNQAAVVPLEEPADAEWMRRVAAEMNLAETAFPVRRGDHWGLRWFTPEIEVELCGHATLASAHVLWETGRAPRGPVAFDSMSGRLVAEPDGDWIALDFPACPAGEVPEPAGLAGALGAAPRFVGFHNGNHLVELASEAEVRDLAPDFQVLGRNEWAVIATARASTPGFDFVSRYFAPSYGINEDSATGSTHCSLAPHWAPRLGKSEMAGYQASRRGGVIRVRHDGDRVRLGGRTVITLRGELAEAALPGARASGAGEPEN